MLTLFLSLFAMTCPAPAEVPSVPRAGRYTLGSDLTYFNTKANYTTEGGTSQDLTQGAGLTHADFSLRLDYDWRRNWRVYSGAGLGWTKTTDGNFTRTNSGPNDIFIGGQYWARVRGVLVAPQADFIYPLVRPDEEADEALTGEGAMRLRAGSWAFLRIRRLRPFVYAAYEFRDGGRSHLLPYRLGTQYRRSATWYAQVEYRGYESVSDDADTGERAPRELYLARVHGGSFHFYSVNPSVSELALEGGYSFGTIDLKGGVAMTLNGASAADGWTALIGLAYSPAPHRSRSGIDEERFNIRPEKYDESLFIDNAEPTRRRPKPRPKQNIDKLLKEAERELE